MNVLNNSRMKENITQKSKQILTFLLFFIILFLTPLSLQSQGFQQSSHGDKKNLPKGCASCHIGHGMYNTPMLPEQKDKFCFNCHGYTDNREKMKRNGYVAKETTLNNLDREFEKPYHHPIEKIRIHEYGETLPEIDQSIARHSECGDCHHHHYVKKGNSTIGIKGINSQGAKIESINSGYELCFKCHSNSANLPPDQTNKAEIFSVSNPSYHPVIAPGKNADVPSLILSLTPSSTIKCTDCHNNNDRTGPKGPHGSEYKYILSRNFNQTEGPEGAFEYELCYHCHTRNSILSNRSFPYHRLHLSTVGASCRTCHNPHGSMKYSHLIDFDNISIRPTSSGRLEFNDFGTRTGQCYLQCHGKDHNPASYPGQIGTPSTSSKPKK